MSVVLSEVLRWLKHVGLNLEGQEERPPRPSLRFWLITAPSWLSMVLMVYDVLRWRNFETTEMNIDGIATLYGVLYKTAFFVVRRKDVVKILRSLGAFKSLNAVPGSDLYLMVQDVNAKALKIIQAFGLSLMVSACAYCFKPLIFRGKVLLVTYTLFCDAEETWCFVISYMCQLACCGFVLVFILIADGFYFALICCVYMEIEALKFGLRDLQGDDGVAHLVKQHNNILTFIVEMNQLFQGVLLHQTAAALLGIWFEVFDISIQGFPPSVSILAKNASFLICYHLELFFECAAGEALSNQALSIGDAAYESDWFGKQRRAKDLLIVMQRASQVVRLKFGQLWYLQLETFLMILKSSISVLAFVQTIYNFDKTP